MPLDERGWEVPDPTPVARALKFTRPVSTLDEIRAAIGLLNREAAQNGQETFSEADDFDVGDDYDPSSPWELRPDQENYVETAVQPPPPAPNVVPGTPAPPSPGSPAGNSPNVAVPPVPPGQQSSGAT